MTDPVFAGYDDLPESIRYLYTPVQYQWLTDDQKRDLMQTELEPEHDE